MSEHGPDRDVSREVDRIAFFSDAVFAIAATLLVVELSPPGPDAALGDALVERLPQIFSFALSFLVITQFWIGHHRVFQHVRDYDTGLIWVNALHLLVIAFLPFPTAVLGDHDSRLATVVYAATLLVASITGFGVWWYLASRPAILHADMDPRVRRQLMARSVVTPAVCLLGLGAAFVGLPWAVACWVLLMPVARIGAGRRYGRG